jgi:hypothetical protein
MKTVCVIKLDAHGVQNKINSSSDQLVTNRRTACITEKDICRLFLFVELHYQSDCAELVMFIGCLCIDIMM